MEMSPEAGPQMADQGKDCLFIRVDMDKATDADYRRLKELGWVAGNVSATGEFAFSWHGEGRPNLPDDIAEKVIGKNSSKIECVDLVNKKNS